MSKGRVYIRRVTSHFRWTTRHRHPGLHLVQIISQGSLCISILDSYGPHPPDEQFFGRVFMLARPRPPAGLLGAPDDWFLFPTLPLCEFVTYLPFGTAAFGSIKVFTNSAMVSAIPHRKSVIKEKRNQLLLSCTDPSEFM